MNYMEIIKCAVLEAEMPVETNVPSPRNNKNISKKVSFSLEVEH